MSDRIPLTFTCPKCGEHRIEEIMVSITVASDVLLDQNPDGSDPGWDYGEQTNDDSDSGHVDRYQCKGCGWTILNDTPEYEDHTEDGLGAEALISRIRELNK